MFSEAAKNAMLNGLVVSVNSGIAILTILEGITPLAVMPLSLPFEQGVGNAKLVFKPIEQVLVSRSGAPDKAVLTAGNDIFIELDIGTDLILSKPILQVGGYFKINELSIAL